MIFHLKFQTTRYRLQRDTALLLCYTTMFALQETFLGFDLANIYFAIKKTRLIILSEISNAARMFFVGLHSPSGLQVGHLSILSLLFEQKYK